MSETSNQGADFGDWRDKAVLQAIRESEMRTLRIRQLHALYREHAEIRQQSTLKTRTKTMLTHGPFTRLPHEPGNTWMVSQSVFRESDGDEDE